MLNWFDWSGSFETLSIRNRWQFYLKFRAMKDGYEREFDGYSDKINKDYDCDVIVKLIN